MKVLWTVFIIYACILGFVSLAAFTGAHSAPQEEAAAAIALAGSVIPFLILRAVTEITNINAAKATKIQENIRAAMAANPAP